MNHFQTVAHLNVQLSGYVSVYKKIFEAKRGIRSNHLEPPLPTGLNTILHF